MFSLLKRKTDEVFDLSLKVVMICILYVTVSLVF